MTAWRQRRKASATVLATLAVLAAAGWSAVPGAGQAATTERVVSDPHSGLGIGGYDPVAYFTDRKPVLGSPDFELSFAGVVWRFRNEGNRAAFVADPDVFMPRFGGYDPTSVVRGGNAPGHGVLWAIVEERLYLFVSEVARDSFLRNPHSTIDAAERAWPAVLRTLSP